MTVQDLIENLRLFPPDDQVYVRTEGLNRKETFEPRILTSSGGRIMVDWDPFFGRIGRPAEEHPPDCLCDAHPLNELMRRTEPK